MTIAISTEPAAEPIVDTNVEQSLTLTTGWDAVTIAIYIEAARKKVEHDTDRTLIDTSYTMYLDNWPTASVIHLPKGPIDSLTSLKYIDGDGNLTTLAADTDFKTTISGDGGRLVEILSWPTLVSDQKDRVEVIFKAGYGTAASDVPGDLKAAILAKVDQIYSKGELATSEYYEDLVRKNKLLFDYEIND